MVTEYRCAVKSHCAKTAELSVVLLGSQDLLCRTGVASSGSYLLRKLTQLWAEPKSVPEPCCGCMRQCYCKQMLKLKLWLFAVHVKWVFPVQGTVYL